MSDREEANKIAIVGMSLSCAGGGRREYWRQLLSTADQSRKAGNSESKLSLAQKLIREAIADANLLNEKTIDVIFHIDSEARASLAALLDLPSRQVRVDSLSNSLANISLAGRELQMRSADTIVVGDVYPDAEDLFGAVVVLRRLEDAERDGNFIYAMLKTSCALEDKSGSSDFVALLKQTYERLDPRAVGLVQICSADDTQVGLESLRDVFGPSVGVVPWCAVGNGNHCGVASVITAALSLHNAILPTAQFGANAFHINDEKTPFYLSETARPWIHGDLANPRYAAVHQSSAHLLLEAYAPSQADKHDSFWPTELFCFSAAGRAELLSLLKQFSAELSSKRETTLDELAATLSRVPPSAYRLAIVARNPADLESKLTLAIDRLERTDQSSWQLRDGVVYGSPDAGDTLGKIAFTFPGYGSYYRGLLSDLCMAFPKARKWFDDLDAIFDEASGPLPSQLLYPPPPAALSPESQKLLAQKLHGMRGGAQAGLVASLVMHELLTDLGVRCDVMVGHSNGENAALIAAGAMRFETPAEFFTLIHRFTVHDDRVVSTDHLPKGVFLSVSGIARDAVQRLIEEANDKLHLAMDNCPHQVVLFVEHAAASEIAQRISQAGGIAVRLPFDRAYHTKLYESQEETLVAIYDCIEFGTPHTAIYSCVNAERFPDSAGAIRELAIRQWTSCVKYRETIERLYLDGVRTFVEIGPNSLLTSFTRDTLRDQPHLALACDTPHVSGLTQLQHVLAQLFARGADLKLDYLFKFRESPRVERITPQAASTVAEANQPDARAIILAGHTELMRQFLDSQQRLLTPLLKALSRNANYQMPADAAGEWPLLGKTLRATAESIYTERPFTTASDPFLLDHAMGRPFRRDSRVSPLPVIPFVVNMEIAAEAASRLTGGDYVVTAITNMRSHRWLAVKRAELRLGVAAEIKHRGPDAAEVSVQLFELDGETRQLAFAATVHLARDFSAAGLSRHEFGQGALLTSEVYEDFLFHGPCFRSVKRVMSCTETEVTAELEVPPLKNFTAGSLAPYLRIPAGLLDAAGQVIALWYIARGSRNFNVFPFQAERFEQYAMPPAAGTPVRCRAAVRRINEIVVEGDVDFFDESGLIFARMAKFQLRHYASSYISKLLAPQSADTFLSEPFMQHETQMICRTIDAETAQVIESGGGIWKHVLARLVLNEPELNQWLRLPRQLEWLLGRVTAKDAVREWAQQRVGMMLSPTEIQIATDDAGRPFVECAKLDGLGVRPHISISHSSGQTSCAVDASRAGIDVEQPSLMTHSLELL